MLDILFDITKREIVMLPDGSDIATTDNPSVQNGGILLYSRCAVLTNPMAGIGMEQFVNGPATNATFEMNRWQAMAKNDGATVAKWAGSTPDNKLLVETVSISYL